MANTEGAKKRNLQTIKKTARNKSATNRVRTFIRKLEDCISNADKEGAVVAFKVAQSEIAAIAQKGIMKQNTASRKISRLNAKVKAISNS